MPENEVYPLNESQIRGLVLATIDAHDLSQLADARIDSVQGEIWRKRTVAHLRSMKHLKRVNDKRAADALRALVGHSH